MRPHCLPRGTLAVLLAVPLAACSTEAERQPQGPIEQAFIDRLEQDGVDLHTDAALPYLDWYCPNMVRPQEDYMRRAAEAGADGEAEERAVAMAAALACRLNETPRGG